MKLFGRIKRSQRGASAVEFALVAPLLFMLVFGIIDFGLGLGASVNISNGAREGARLAAVDNNPVNVEAAVRVATKSLNQTLLTVTINCTKASGGGSCAGGLAGGKSGDRVEVVVVYKYQVLTPISAIIGRDMTLSATSAMRIE